MGMHDDDGIYTAICRFYGRRPQTEGPLNDTTTQHTSQAAALDTVHEELQKRQDLSERIDITITRDDTPQREVVFATGPTRLNHLRPAIDQARSAYSRAWDVLKALSNDVVTELRNPESVVHRPLSPELRDVAWSAQNVYDAGLSAPSSDVGERAVTQHEVTQHEVLESHLAREVDRAKDRARGAGHSEAQIEAAARTDPDLDMRSLRQQSADLVRTVRDLAADPSLTPPQAHALLAAANRAEDTVAELAAHSGVSLIHNAVGAAMGGRSNSMTSAAALAAADYPIAATSVLISPHQTSTVRPTSHSATQEHGLSR